MINNSSIFSGSSMTFFGLRVMESQWIEPEPVLRIRDNVPCAEPFRSQINAWLREMFGVRHVAYVSSGNIFMNPRDAVMIRNLAVA